MLNVNPKWKNGAGVAAKQNGRIPKNAVNQRRASVTMGPGGKRSGNRQAVEGGEERAEVQVLLMMTRAPSFPRTPLSLAFGLLSRPFLRLRKPSIPDGFSALGFCIREEL